MKATHFSASSMFQRTIADGDRARRDTQRRLRELKSTYDDVRVF